MCASVRWKFRTWLKPVKIKKKEKPEKVFRMRLGNDCIITFSSEVGVFETNLCKVGIHSPASAVIIPHFDQQVELPEES